MINQLYIYILCIYIYIICIYIYILCIYIYIVIYVYPIYNILFQYHMYRHLRQDTVENLAAQLLGGDLPPCCLNMGDFCRKLLMNPCFMVD